MELSMLDKLTRNLYDFKVAMIKGTNIQLEREFFSLDNSEVPLPEIMQGASYEDHMQSFKNAFKKANDNELSQYMYLLEDYFFFSAGHDLMYKLKLRADLYTSEPIDGLVYPILINEVKKKYNEESLVPTNPHVHDNVAGIAEKVVMFLDLQALLYMLYCHDFQFPDNWHLISPEYHEEIIRVLNESKMTIGDFLLALVDFKCDKIEQIVMSIEDEENRKAYLDEVGRLREAKRAEVSTFMHINLPITYFLDHTMSDFIRMQCDEILAEDDEQPATPDGINKLEKR